MSQKKSKRGAPKRKPADQHDARARARVEFRQQHGELLEKPYEPGRIAVPVIRDGRVEAEIRSIPAAPPPLTPDTRGALERARFLRDLVSGAMDLIVRAELSDEEHAETVRQLDAAYHAFFGREAAVHVRNAFIHAVENEARAPVSPAREVIDMLVPNAPPLARELFGALYPEAAARLDNEKVRAAVRACRDAHGKWEALRAAIAGFEDNPPGSDSIKRQWLYDPRSRDVRTEH